MRVKLMVHCSEIFQSPGAFQAFSRRDREWETVHWIRVRWREVDERSDAFGWPVWRRAIASRSNHRIISLDRLDVFVCNISSTAWAGERRVPLDMRHRSGLTDGERSFEPWWIGFFSRLPSNYVICFSSICSVLLRLQEEDAKSKWKTTIIHLLKPFRHLGRLHTVNCLLKFIDSIS